MGLTSLALLGVSHNLIGDHLLETRFISVKVGVVWCSNKHIQTERIVRQNFRNMRHHRHSVKRRLPVKQYHVAVHQMPIHDIALKEFNRLGVQMLERNRTPIHTLNRLGSWIRIGAVLNQLVEFPNIERRHFLRKRQIRRNLERNAEFLDGNIRVWRNDGTGRELDTLTLKIRTDTTLLGS